jgi:hypothetical protein
MIITNYERLGISSTIKKGQHQATSAYHILDPWRRIQGMEKRDMIELNPDGIEFHQRIMH